AVEQLALAASDGEQAFRIMKESQFSSLSKPRRAAIISEAENIRDVITVRTETLVTAYHRLKQIHGFRRPFLKLDTQGYDVTIISRALPAMKEFIGLQSELAVSRLYQTSVDFRDALTLYEDCGFALSAFVPNNAGHFPRLVEIDCIMVRRDLLK